MRRLLALVALSLYACTPAAGPAITDLGACILARAAIDQSLTPPMPATEVVIDVIAFCRTDEITVLQTLGAVKAASLRFQHDAGMP